MKQYEVTFVRPDDLPSEHRWALARDESTGITYVFVKRCEVCPRVLEEAWAAYRRIVRKLHLAA